MALTCTIGGVAYPIIENNGSPVPGYSSGGSGASSSSGSSGIAGGSDSGYQQTNNAQERQRWQCDIMDYDGTAHFQPGELVVVTDPTLGIMFQGYVNTDKVLPIYPSGIIRHSLDCVGLEWLPSKRTYTATYSTSQVAGKIAVDMLNNVLLPEGIAQNFAEHTDTSTTDFSTGILAGTQGVTDANGNQWLELAQAGQNTTITENTTALFSTGTLTNVVAANNTLSPTTTSGLKVVATLPFSQVGALLTVNFWSGSKALGTNDTFNFSIFISSSSPAITCSVGLMFNDGTRATGIVDQNGFAIDAATDLSANAKDQWYTRAFSTSTYNGKTISKVYVAFGGTSQGVYTMYVQNVYLTSDPTHPFFSTTAVTTQLNPMVVASSGGYAPTSIIASVIPVVNPSASSRISPAYSIDAVKLLSSSVIAWLSGGSQGGGCTISASYDGGTTYIPCTNNAPLPALPAGSNVAGLTITLKELFTVGTDPTIIPTLSNVSVSLVSAPTATKSDIVTTFATQAAWNTGTLTGAVALSNGDLTTGAINCGWNLSRIINQTFFQSNTSKTSQSVSKGTYTQTVVVDSSTDMRCISRLDWAGTLSNTSFIFDIDLSVPSTFNYSSAATIHYLQTYWDATHQDGGNGAYTLSMQQSGIAGNIIISRGTNSSTSTQTNITSTTQNTPTHVRISVQSGVHNIYFDNDTTPLFSFTDTTYTSGQIGIGAHTFFQNPNGGGPGVFTYSNPAITPGPTETWASPSTSINSLGTCGNSVITWAEANTGAESAVFVESSIDGGSTYQTCVSGEPIPNLPSGTNVSGKSIKLLISFYCSPSAVYLPILRQLVWRVLGDYPGSSGTRSTVPLGNDTMVRGNVVGGWGTGFDSQTYTKVGTGTIALTSDEGLITNTTGDVHMVYGSRTWTDEDGTVRFQLSASTISAGIELRYTDANNFYRLQASTTTVSIIKKSAGTTYTLATLSMTIPTGTSYRMRFRVTGAGPVILQGNVWQDGVIEPTINATTGQWNDSLWTITGVD